MICETKGILLPEWNDRVREKACVVHFCKSMMDIARQESCGKCVLCREGTWQAYELISDITTGKANRDDEELLREILGLIKANAACEMSVTAATRCVELMEEYADDWNQHLTRKRCSKGICNLPNNPPKVSTADGKVSHAQNPDGSSSAETEEGTIMRRRRRGE